MLKWIVLIVIAFLIAAGSAILEAYLEVQKKPKEDMFYCNVHGPFRKKHCIPLFPELMGVAENSFICPTCYKKTVFDDPNRKLYQ